MASKRYYADGAYAGEEGKRTQEMQDGGMISEDRSAIANLPQNVVIKAYPMPGNYLPEDLDDTLRGVDGQMSKDNAKRQQIFAPKKV